MGWLNNLRKLLRFENKLKTEEDRICGKIEELNRRISNYHSILNQESIWLFLSTLCLWSIPLSPLVSQRLIVAALLFIAFSLRIKWRKGNTQESFPKQIKIVESQIASSNLDKKTKESMFYKLNEAKMRITGISAYKNTWIFIIYWCYYGVCFWFFADTVLVSMRDRLLESLQ